MGRFLSLILPLIFISTAGGEEFLVADVGLKIRAAGTPENPIEVSAENPGKVLLTGNSRISISGHHLVVDGLFWFLDPTGEESIELQTRSGESARDCRITNCAVSGERPGGELDSPSRFTDRGIGSTTVTSRERLEN